MLIRLVLALAASAGTASSQDSGLENGRDLFMYFCAECHGKDAASGGPMAEMLAIVPPDLTDLTERYGGMFPLETVAMQIDGSNPIVAHGDMPMFGPSLDSNRHVALPLSSGQPMMVPQPLADVLAYLQSIQVGAEKTE